MLKTKVTVEWAESIGLVFLCHCEEGREIALALWNSDLGCWEDEDEIPLAPAVRAVECCLCHQYHSLPPAHVIAHANTIASQPNHPSLIWTRTEETV